MNYFKKLTIAFVTLILVFGVVIKTNNHNFHLITSVEAKNGFNKKPTAKQGYKPDKKNQRKEKEESTKNK